MRASCIVIRALPMGSLSQSTSRSREGTRLSRCVEATTSIPDGPVMIDETKGIVQVRSVRLARRWIQSTALAIAYRSIAGGPTPLAPTTASFFGVRTERRGAYSGASTSSSGFGSLASAVAIAC